MAKTPNSQVNKALAYLTAAFPDAPEFGDMNYEVYYDALCEYSFDQILAGFKRFVQKSGSAFFPSAPQIVRWVDPKSPVDEVFEAALADMVSHEARRKEVVLAFLEMKHKAGERFVLTKMHEETPYRDTWEWIPSIGTAEYPLISEMKSYSSIEMAKVFDKSDLMELPGSVRLALWNAARLWVLADKREPDDMGPPGDEEHGDGESGI